MFEILDPTYSEAADELAAAERPPTLQGLTVGIVSNGKQNTATFFDALEHELREQHGVAEVVRLTKGNYSAPAEAEIMNAAQSWHALIAGIGD